MTGRLRDFPFSVFTSPGVLEEMSMNPLWKVYKSKVMKTLNPDTEEEPAEEVMLELIVNSKWKNILI